MKSKIILTEENLDSLDKAKKILHENPHITINGLAQETGLNRNKLNYGFKILFGVTINEYEIKVKMEKAMILLATTNNSIKQIAIKSGYKNLKSFSTAFKKQYDQSPSSWRKEYVSRETA